MLCKKCGAEIPDDADRCEYCGSPIVQPQQDDTASQNEENRRKQIDKMMEDKRAQLDEIKQRRDDKRLRQKRVKIIGISAACVIGAAAIGGGGYYIYGTVTGGAEPVQVTPTPVPTMLPTAIAPSTSPTATPTAIPSALPSPTATAQNNASWAATGSNNGSGSSSNRSTAGTSSSGNSSTKSSSSKTSSSGSSSSKGSSSGGSSGGSSSSSANTVTVRNSGVTTSPISSQAAVGNEVINDGGNWYMTFTSGGVKYYAYVNPGATTDQVKNVNYMLTAEPTDVTYNGNTVYEITSMTKYNGTVYNTTSMTNYSGQDYILPQSGTQLLTRGDLSGLGKNDLALARNEIYARHGRRFKTTAYQQYFESKPWYHESSSYNYDDENSNLSDIEIKNVQLIIDCEK